MGDIDIRLTSMLRNLQYCEENINTLISQIKVTVERFSANDKWVTKEANQLIYEFKQILHQIKKNNVLIMPNAEAVQDKMHIDEMFEANSLITSVKLGYIAEIANVKRIEAGNSENS